MSIRILASVLVAALLWTGAVAAPVGTEHAAPETVSTTPALLTAEEAKAIALKHAGLTADQVTRLKAEYELDDGVPEYEVEFRVENYEYDYTIHAETGEILRSDKEYDPPETKPVETTPVETTTPALLTAEEAKAIALKHAGLTADQATRLKAEYELDDGVPEYEVEFRCGGWEYEYEIHAETGKILKSDKEWDD